MSIRLFGQETEYAYSVLDAEGKSMLRERPAWDLVLHAGQLAPNLRCGPTDLFFPWGRLYIDCGAHPEFSTAECADPWELVRMVLAGESTLIAATNALAEAVNVGSVFLTRCNVDYWAGSHATWGCHESYMHSGCFDMAREIVPHLVSRPVITGAGGFDTITPGAVPQYMASPRVAHLQKVCSQSSTSERGIFHTKNESLSGRHCSRLHLLCGESLCSQMSAWLKSGTTALVVAMVDAGLKPGDGVQLRDPLAAMNTFARDVRCRATARTVDGRRLRAIDIQRHYLDQAQSHADDERMPAWTSEVCVRWGNVLDRLEQGAPESVCTMLDWAIKWSLMQAHAEDRGLDWEHLADCEPEAVAKLRPELYEIDIRFGRLGPQGIFSALDAAGVLNHRIDGVEVDDLSSLTPSTGRARLRAERIRELSGHSEQYFCIWQRIVDNGRRRMIDLQDPLVTQKDWEPLPEPPEEGSPPRRGDASELLNMVTRRIGRQRFIRPRFRRGTRVIATMPTTDQPGLTTRPAVVTAVERDPRGIVYRLDIDQGQGVWRGRQLRRAPREEQTALPF